MSDTEEYEEQESNNDGAQGGGGSRGEGLAYEGLDGTGTFEVPETISLILIHLPVGVTQLAASRLGESTKERASKHEELPASNGVTRGEPAVGSWRAYASEPWHYWT
jgi:hypothetical protein